MCLSKGEYYTYFEQYWILTCVQSLFASGQTFTHFAISTQFKFNSIFWLNFKNVSIRLIILEPFSGVKTPYSAIPVFVNMISSQNGAITTVDESGNDTGK